MGSLPVSSSGEAMAAAEQAKGRITPDLREARQPSAKCVGRGRPLGAEGGPGPRDGAGKTRVKSLLTLARDSSSPEVKKTDFCSLPAWSRDRPFCLPVVAAAAVPMVTSPRRSGIAWNRFTLPQREQCFLEQ